MSGYRKAFWLLLILTAVPFMVDQVRIGLYPQLEKPWQTVSRPQRLSGETPPAAPEVAAVMDEQAISSSMMPSKVRNYAADAVESYSSPVASSENYERIDPGARVQTGPGLPEWQWRTVRLSWNGSVDASQQVRFWYFPPAVNLILNFVRVAFVAVLAILMFGVADRLRIRLRPLKSALLWLALMPMLILPTPKVHADFPDPALLETLKNRLLEAPDCLPNCAHISEMDLAVSESLLDVTLQIEAQEAVTVPLPADYEQWFPNRVSVDGKAVAGLFRQQNGS